MSVQIFEPPADIFKSGAYALVVPVNCLGAAGKGLALQAARRYPTWAFNYRNRCVTRSLKPGKLHHTQVEPDKDDPHGFFHIVSLATKDDWRKPSRLEWVESGLCELAAWCRRALPPAVALPALGCGLGGLPWSDVRPLTEHILGEVRGVQFWVYAPHEARP